MNELKFTGKYSTLENLREAFPNGGSLGDFATIKGISYYYNPILSDWTTDYPESLFTEKNAYDENFLGDYPDLGLVWKDYPNGGGQGNYITISGIKYFWNERDRKWEIGIGENIPPGLPEGDPNKFYNEQGKFVYVNTSKYVIYGNYIDDIHFQSNGKDAELKTDTLYIDKDTLKSYIYVNNKLIKTGLTEEEILRLFKKTSVTNTALIKIHSSDGFGLKSDGTTAGLTGYHVYRYNLSSYIDNGVWSAPLKKVAVTGVSSASTAEEFCLATAHDKNDVFLKAFYVRTGQNYTKQVLEMPANAQYVRVCGTDALMPACYEVEDRWIFYTTEEVDALLANFNTEVHHDLTLKGNGKPDDNLSVNEEGLNSLDKYFVNTAEKAQITTNKNDITDLRALKTLITVSQNIIEVDCSKDLIESTNSGTSTAVFSFINLPSQKGTVRLIVKNARVADFAITLPYLNIVVGGVTYSFRNMTLANASLTCFAGKSIEINFLFVKTAENAYTISIAAIYEY